MPESRNEHAISLGARSPGRTRPFPRIALCQNLVVNGNLETGSPLPWVQSGNTSNSGISPNAQNPLTASAMNQLGYQSGPITTGFLTQMIPAIPGALYDVGFWFALPAPPRPVIPRHFQRGGNLSRDQHQSRLSHHLDRKFHSNHGDRGRDLAPI